MFYDLDDGPAAAFQHMSVLYFTMLLFELLPFCYMSFYVWDRKFFLSDRASDLYSTSAYYMAHMAASERLSTSRAEFRHALLDVSVHWRPILSIFVGNLDSSPEVTGHRPAPPKEFQTCLVSAREIREASIPEAVL